MTARKSHLAASAGAPGGVARFEQLLKLDACKVIPVSVIQHYFPGQYGLDPSYGAIPGTGAPTGACVYYPSGAGAITVAYSLRPADALVQARKTQLPSSIRIAVGEYGIINKPDSTTSEVVFFDVRYLVEAETVGRPGVAVSTLEGFARAVEQALPL